MVDFIKAYRRNPTPLEFCPIDSDEDLIRLLRFGKRVEGISVSIVAPIGVGEIVAQLEGKLIKTERWTLPELLGKRIVYDGMAFELWPGDEFDAKYTEDPNAVGEPAGEVGGKRETNL